MVYHHTIAWSIASTICVVFTVFNVIPILVILYTRALRRRMSYHFVLAFLVGSALQGCTAAPLYIYKKVAFDEDTPFWLCDASRFTYIYFGHILKLCLLLISFDRLLAIHFPYKYKHLTKRTVALIILTGWSITAVVDCLPFLNTGGSCDYNPTRSWSIAVIATYNIVPFILILVNYVVIWRIAARINLTTHNRKSTLVSQDSTATAEQGKSKMQLLLEMKATKHSLVLLFVYLVCWTPLGVYYLLDQFCADHCLSATHKMAQVRAGIKILSYTSGVFSPLVYCWWNAEFVSAAKKMFRRLFCCNNDHTESFNSTETHSLVLKSPPSS